MAIYSQMEMNQAPEIQSAEGSGLQLDAQAPRSFAKRALFGLICLAVFLMIVDLSMRLFGWGPRVFDPPRYEPNGVPFTRLGNGPIGYQPGTEFSSVYDPAGNTRGYFDGDGRVTYRINSRGGRGPEYSIPKPPGGLRIVCLGDSFTFGEGVKEEDTWPSLVGALLQKRHSGGPVQVMNAGVQGHNTKDEAALYLLSYAQYKPDIVILGFVLNDATDSAETIRQNEASKKDLPLSPLGSISKIVEILNRGTLARQRQQEFLETTRRSFDSANWMECNEVLKGMARVSREDRFRFIVVIFPIFWELDGDYPFTDIHNKIAIACKAAGCECIDLLATFRGQDAESLWVHPTDQHPNEIAHRMAAERIAEFLAAPKN